MRYWHLLFALVAVLVVAACAYAPFSPDWWLPAGPDAAAARDRPAESASATVDGHAGDSDEASGWPKSSHLHSASTYGRRIDNLFWMILIITGVVFIGTQVALVYAAYRYADRPGRVAEYYHGSQRLEVIWTIIPAAILVFIALYQMGTWAEIKFRNAAPKVQPVAEVVARQFQWTFRYPGPDGRLHTTDDLRMVNDLHFVKNKQALIHLKSSDVLHSFFLPQLRIKQDAVPGLTIPVWFDADQAGHYELVCAELCGWGHYKMRSNVTVHENQAEYDEWERTALREQNRDRVTTAAAPAATADTASQGN